MSRPAPVAVVVATVADLTGARATARTAQSAGLVSCVVVDVDGGYHPVLGEQVVGLADAADALGLRVEAAHAALTLDPAALEFYAGVVGASYALAGGTPTSLVLGAGVHVLADLRAVALGGAATVVPGVDATGVLRRSAPVPVQVRRPGGGGQLTLRGSGSGPLFDRALYAIGSGGQVGLLRSLAADWRTAGSALDTFAVAVGASVEAGGDLLLGPWRSAGPTTVDGDGRLCAAGRPVRAVDLTGLDVRRPWLLDSEAGREPLVLLSEHPALARVVAAEAAARLGDEAVDIRPDGDRGPTRLGLDPVLRDEARRSVGSGSPADALPDLLGVDAATALEAWALTLVPPGHPSPVARYLDAVRRARPDLQRRFRAVPGADSAALAEWAAARSEGGSVHDGALLAAAAGATVAAAAAAPSETSRPAVPGVNLVGYLAGELGLGVSARLVDDALQAVGVATSTYDVGGAIVSRQGATYRQSSGALHDTTLICVNAVDTPAVAAQLDPAMRRNRVIGMWYWELEDFPDEHAAGFEHVDEVWAATDFMRDAIAAKAGETPVRTVMPPLPQAGDDPGVVPPHLGIPSDRPWFLFTFDFLSLAVRKNPYGLVEAFTRAFADLPDERRPLLVIKTINAAEDPAHAERLRLQVADRADILFLDTYLDNHERHVLVSHCTAYVSLHRAEGLGLTVAEAMAWGRPVITTAYGGVMQFCHEQNAFLVDWERGHIEESAGPYRQGLPWAEPDLDHAARLMRAVIDDPELAASIGARAGRDIRKLHGPEVAGRQMVAALEDGDAQWRAARAEARARRQARRRERRAEDGRDPVAAPQGDVVPPTNGVVRRPATAGPSVLRRLVGAAARRVRR